MRRRGSKNPKSRDHSSRRMRKTIIKKIEKSDIQGTKSLNRLSDHLDPILNILDQMMTRQRWCWFDSILLNNPSWSLEQSTRSQGCSGSCSDYPIVHRFSQVLLASIWQMLTDDVFLLRCFFVIVVVLSYQTQWLFSKTKTGVANAGDLKYLGINYNILHKKTIDFSCVVFYTWSLSIFYVILKRDLKTNFH